MICGGDGLNPQMVSAVICELGVVRNICDLIENSPVSQNITEVFMPLKFCLLEEKGEFLGH